jgi:hypothetical protein
MTMPDLRPRPPLRAGRFAFALLLLALVPGSAPTEGINVSWDDWGRAGKADLAASCVETPVPYVLVGSVVPPGGLVKVNGFQAYLDVQVEGSSLPSWWEMGEGCRKGKISASFDSTSGPFSCEQPWGMVAIGAMLYEDRMMYGGLANGTPAGNRAHFRVIGAVSDQFARPDGGHGILSVQDFHH